MFEYLQWALNISVKKVYLISIDYYDKIIEHFITKIINEYHYDYPYKALDLRCL